MNPLTPYPITPIGNFLGVVLALLPLISQIRKLSLAVWAYAIWIAVYCFQMFVNSIIWHDNDNVVAPVWCDIGEGLLYIRLLYESLLTGRDSNEIASGRKRRHSCMRPYDLHTLVQNHTPSCVRRGNQRTGMFLGEYTIPVRCSLRMASGLPRLRPATCATAVKSSRVKSSVLPLIVI